MTAMTLKTILVIMAYASLLVQLQGRGAMAGTIGINWGRMNAQRMVPSMVVDLLLQNNISAARVYTAQDDILEAFKDSGINLTVGIFRPHLIDSIDAAKKWVDARIKYFDTCNIRRIVMGSGAIQVDAVGNKRNMIGATKALGYVQDVLNQRQFGDKIKVTIEIAQTALMPNFSKPSDAAFLDALQEDIRLAINTLRQIKSPIFVAIFPISYINDNVGFNPEFAYMDGRSNLRITDVNGLVYTNIVEFLIDSYVWALQKVGGGDIELVVSTIGWPTDGYPGATAANAERFFKTFLPWVASNKGTPMRPGLNLNVYVNSLSDENLMPYRYPFSRHWGIYTSYGDAKYKIDLSGQGRDIYPTTAKGILRMPKRWCVLNEDKLGDIELNVSYAFNMFFQLKFQREAACNYLKVAKVVVENPSVGTCIFPVEVVKPQEGHQRSLIGGAAHNQVTKYLDSSMLFLSLIWVLVWN